jgi:hypothetical protein
MVDEAAALAQRLLAEVPASALAANYQRIDLAYRLLYSRSPTDEEMRLGLKFITSGSSNASDRWQQYAHVLLAANELLYVD